MEPIELRPVGRVSSPLKDRAEAPKQADEGAPQAWLELEDAIAGAALGIESGDRVVLITWLDRAHRDVLQNHPRSDPANPLTGVFANRSPDRPNPIGLHEVEVAEIDGARIRVTGLEALDGTPILDIKAVLGPIETR